MGIKNLRKFLKDKYPELFKDYHISKLSGKKVAIDTSRFLYRFKATCGEEWLNLFISLITTLKKYNVHGNFIFDGKPPPEKIIEQNRRRSSKNKLDENIVELSNQLNVYKSSGSIGDKLQKAIDNIQNKDQKRRLLCPIDVDVEQLEAYLEKKELQSINISQQDKEDLKTLLDLLGIPYIQAPGEAEALAVYLAKTDDETNKVAAVIVDDTDVLTYGLPVYLSQFTNSGHCEVLYIEEMLESLNMTQSQFVDFCIMSGTDYNDNIPNYGTSKAFKIISELKTIEAFIEQQDIKENPLDYKVLSHQRVREIFSTFGDLTSQEIYKSRFWDTRVNIQDVFKFLNSKSCKYYPSVLRDLWKLPEIILEE